MAQTISLDSKCGIGFRNMVFLSHDVIQRIRTLQQEVRHLIPMLLGEVDHGQEGKDQSGHDTISAGGRVASRFPAMDAFRGKFLVNSTYPLPIALGIDPVVINSVNRTSSGRNAP